MCRLLITPLNLEGVQSSLGMIQLPQWAIGRGKGGERGTIKDRKKEETRIGKNGRGDIKMENLTETFASAFGNSSPLIQFHQITQSIIFAQSMLQK